MKTITISMITILVAVTVSLRTEAEYSAFRGQDMLAALNGDTVRFERGMKKLEEYLSSNPNDPEAKVLHGNGVMARSGEAFKTGDMANAAKAVSSWAR
jgi:hypothetical protein